MYRAHLKIEDSQLTSEKKIGMTNLSISVYFKIPKKKNLNRYIIMV